jgi:hypothetical protein
VTAWLVIDLAETVLPMFDMPGGSSFRETENDPERSRRPASGLPPEAVRATFGEAGLAGAIRLVLERDPSTFESNFKRAEAELYVGDTEAALQSLDRMVEGHDA